MFKIYWLLFLVFFTELSSAQDTIFFKKEGKFQVANVIENTPKQISYRKPENPDGPIYIVNWNTVMSIHYANGTVELRPVEKREERTYKWHEGKTHIHIVATDILFGMATLAPERSILNGMLSLRVPFSYGLVAAGIMDTLINLQEPFFTSNRMESKVLGYYDNGKIFSIGGEVYYYPPIKKPFKYFVGLAFGYGRSNYATPVHPFDPTKPVWYARDESHYNSYFLKNGLWFDLSRHFSIAATFGIGINKTWIPYYNHANYSKPSDYFPETFRAIEGGVSAGITF